MSFDRVQLLRGDAAEKYAREHGGDSEAARSGLIVNENPRTRDLVLAPDVKVLGGVQLAASSDPEPVPLTDRCSTRWTARAAPSRSSCATTSSATSSR